MSTWAPGPFALPCAACVKVAVPPSGAVPVCDLLTVRSGPATVTRAGWSPAAFGSLSLVSDTAVPSVCWL